MRGLDQYIREPRGLAGAGYLWAVSGDYQRLATRQKQSQPSVPRREE